MPSAYNLCKQFGPRSGPTERIPINIRTVKPARRMNWFGFELFIKLTISFCRLLITFANSLDPDQDRQNVGPDLDPSRLTL